MSDMRETTRVAAETLADLLYRTDTDLRQATVAWVESTDEAQRSLEVPTTSQDLADCYARIRKSTFTPETMRVIADRMTELVFADLHKEA